MKLATLDDGTRDGALAVVSRDLKRATRTPKIAKTMQYALDEWERCEPLLRDVAKRLETGPVDDQIAFDANEALAPLPRCYQWADASAYVNHVELVRRARGADMPASFWTEPMMYQGAGDCNLSARAPIEVPDFAMGCDFEGEVAIVTGDVPGGIRENEAGQFIRLFMILNDVTLRNLVPSELAKGFGFFQSKPQTAFSPVAVTSDEFEGAWDQDRIHLPLIAKRGEQEFGRPNAGKEMVFGFRRLIAHAARTRPLVAGTIIGSGTVSNADPGVGATCIAEIRAREMIEFKEARTEFLKPGERVRFEMLDGNGINIFGSIDQQVKLRPHC
jgi:fumarylacetoacetate (FAA) hydrolase